MGGSLVGLVVEKVDVGLVERFAEAVGLVVDADALLFGLARNGGAAGDLRVQNANQR